MLCGRWDEPVSTPRTPQVSVSAFLSLSQTNTHTHSVEPGQGHFNTHSPLSDLVLCGSGELPHQWVGDGDGVV